jgi:hypothetical protein
MDLLIPPAQMIAVAFSKLHRKLQLPLWNHRRQPAVEPHRAPVELDRLVLIVATAETTSFGTKSLWL